MSITVKTKKKIKADSRISIKNKKAHFDYYFLDNYTAGIVLRGCEIKSIRNGKVSISEAYCYFFKNILWVKGMHIGQYSHNNSTDNQVAMQHKLLLNKKELKKLSINNEKGITIIPKRLYINEKGLAKLEIALAKGKKNYDKRTIIKERESNRSLKNVEFGT